jgi:hypothetical protein
MLARRPDETNNIIVLNDHDEVGGAGLPDHNLGSGALVVR